MNAVRKIKEVGGDVPTNGGQSTIEAGIPYMVNVEITGSADLLFHRWNCEAVDEKAKASKNSKAKKSDDIESYVYRDDDGFICLPGEYLRQAIITAAKFRQDPRSPRKSAMDLFKAAVISLTPLAPISGAAGKARKVSAKEWDYLDRRRVVIQRSGINRTRPAMKAGWSVEIKLMVNLPEYVHPSDLNEVISAAGRLIGVGDFRPTYGRFNITKFEVEEA